MSRLSRQQTPLSLPRHLGLSNNAGTLTLTNCTISGNSASGNGGGLPPLKGMKLNGLDIRGTRVTGLSPLKGMPSKELACDFQHERDTEVLRLLTTLERINDKPAADFWKEVDGL